MDNNEVMIRDARIPIEFQVIEDLWHSSGSGIHLGDSDTIQEIEKNY
jgi:hypothetical protein